jgi:hypothetical protein
MLRGRAIALRLAPVVVLLGVLVSACAQGPVVSPSPTVAKPTPTSSSSETSIDVHVRAAANAYLQARTQMLVRGVPDNSLRDVCEPGSGLADRVLWWAAGTRASGRGREIGVPRRGYVSASLTVLVRRVTIDQEASMASVLAFTRPGPEDKRLVDSSPAYHLVSLVRTESGRWLAKADISTAYDPDLPTYLEAGGAPAAVVAAARADVRRAHDPGTAPAGSLTTLRAWCAAMNARDATALKTTFTPDSDIQNVSDAQIEASLFASSSPPDRRDWRVVGMKLLGTQIPGVACGWVSYRFMSDQAASVPGSRGYAAFAYLERQADGRWLIFSPPA